MQYCNDICVGIGKPHTIDVKVELWPEITYSNTNGYKGLSVTVTKDPFDFDKYEKTKKSIQERYKDVQDTDSSYIAKVWHVFMTINHATSSSSLNWLLCGIITS